MSITIISAGPKPSESPKEGKVYIENDTLYVKHLFSDNKLIRTIPNHKFLVQDSVWSFPLTQIDKVLEKLPHYKVDGSVPTFLARREAERNRNATSMAEFDDRKLDTESEYNPLLKVHQKKVVHLIKSNDIKRYALFLDTGTGKTFTALELIKQLNPKRCLVVCPLSLVRSVWLKEAKQWYPDMDVRAVWDPSSNARSLTSLKAILERKGQVNIITFATFRNIVDNLIALQESDDPIYDMIIVDESSIMKDASSKTTKALLAFGETVEKCFILSGCPAPNSPAEYYSQIRLIDESVLGNSPSGFLAKYTTSQWGGKPVFTQSSIERLMEDIGRVSIVIKKQDCLDLPEHAVVVRDVIMEGKQAETYKTLMGAMAAKLDNSLAVVPKNVLARVMKMRQITSGFVRPTDLLEDDETDIHDIKELDDILKGLGIRPIGPDPHASTLPPIFDLSDGKCEEVISILTDELPNESVVIWLQFNYEFEKLGRFLKKAGIAYHAFHGATNKADMEWMEDEFKSGKVRVLLAHPRSVAHGHTWVHCAYDIVVSLSYSFEEWKQSKDRLHRMGQTRPCTRIVLASIFLDGTKTIDHMLLDVVEEKADIDTLCTDMLRGRWNG